MQPETNGVNTNTWLEASKEMKIAPYIVNYMSMPTSVICKNPYPPSMGLYDAFRNISVPISMQRAVTSEPQLEVELRAWDILSDEALIGFEQRL